VPERNSSPLRSRVRATAKMMWGQDPASQPSLPQLGSSDQAVPSRVSIQSYPSPARSSAGRTGPVTGSAVSVVTVWVNVWVLMRCCSVSLGRGGCWTYRLPSPTMFFACWRSIA
jgi:hypothetical protein